MPRAEGSKKGKKRKAGADAADEAAPQQESGAHGTPPAEPSSSEEIAKKKKKKKKTANFTESRVATLPTEEFAKGVRSGGSAGGGGARDGQKVGPKFGETNDRPPELMLSGQLAKKAARAGGATSAQDRALALQREAVLQNYKAARAKRAGGDGASKGRPTFAAPFLSFPGQA
eukprot:6707811-Prymnesium_polylepis.1